MPVSVSHDKFNIQVKITSATAEFVTTALFDTGSNKTYIPRDLERKLGLTRMWSEPR